MKKPRPVLFIRWVPEIHGTTEKYTHPFTILNHDVGTSDPTIYPLIHIAAIVVKPGLADRIVEKLAHQTMNGRNNLCIHNLGPIVNTPTKKHIHSAFTWLTRPSFSLFSFSLTSSNPSSLSKASNRDISFIHKSSSIS